MHIDYKTFKPIIDKQIEMNKKAEELKKKYGNFESIKKEQEEEMWRNWELNSKNV